MDLFILAVGKLRASYREACDEYLRRMRRYARVEEREVRETHGAPASVVQRRDDAALLDRVPEGAILVALTRTGAAWSSGEVARRLGRWRGESRPVALVLGGSHGLGSGLLDQAAHRWSLGPLTLPHELARVIVTEQLYRGFTILEGHPYHKGGKQ